MQAGLPTQISAKAPREAFTRKNPEIVWSLAKPGGGGWVISYCHNLYLFHHHNRHQHLYLGDLWSKTIFLK